LHPSSPCPSKIMHSWPPSACSCALHAEAGSFDLNFDEERKFPMNGRLIGVLTVVAAISLTVYLHASDGEVKAADADEGGVAGSGCGIGDCFVAHPTPGCAIFACCGAVCDVDPFCCDSEWDNFCVGTANIICTTCGGAGAGSCFFAHPNPACNNSECCNIVCAQDAFCCNTQWDNICANAATQMCTCGGGLAGSCFQTHESAWCNDSECCQLVCANDPYCCETVWDQNCVNNALAFCTCGGVFTESCFKVHDDSTPWCRRADCCNEVCAADPFCCDVTWDNFCVGGAYNLCCPADVVPFLGDGVVDVDDLLAVINSWGTCFDPEICYADLSPNGGNGVVNVDDLLFVINHWGPCE
jgi:hypothetical protein